MVNRPILLVFYQNLRFHDQPLLTEGIQQRNPLIPIFINDPCLIDQLGGASQWWLYQSLFSFQQAWKETFNMQLILRQGDTLQVLQQLVDETNAQQIYLGKRYTALERDIDRKIEENFKQQHIQVKFFNTHLLTNPEGMHTQQGNNFQIFTPFWKACTTKIELPLSSPHPTSIFNSNSAVHSESLTSWKFPLIQNNWTQKLAKKWQPSERQALKTLQTFLGQNLNKYDIQHDLITDPPLSSQLSPYLRWGQVSVRQVFSEVKHALNYKTGNQAATEVFLKELGWREFSYYLLTHYPSMETTPLDKKFQYFIWQDNPSFLKKWQQGLTGYPIIDAGMRQLWLEGWIPNRLRMVVASFLIKDLLVDWQHGLAWFGDTLVDADPASNANNWQWVAGCGTDSAPYFRVFNPITQSKKFEQTGDYIKTYIPELQKVPPAYLHHPWTMSSVMQKKYNIQIGKDYPYPLVDHATQRNKALLYWKIFQKNRSPAK